MGRNLNKESKAILLPIFLKAIKPRKNVGGARMLRILRR
jgi:hypothetical protein